MERVDHCGMRGTLWCVTTTIGLILLEEFLVKILLDWIHCVGILSVPYALASGGWLSLALLFSIAAAAFYTGLLIKRCGNLSNMFPIGEVQMAGLAIGGMQFFVIMVALIFLPTVWLDNLSILSYLSASGVFASVVIILSKIWTATVDGVGCQQKRTLVNWNGLPTAVSLYAFGYCAHPVFPTFL
ncbi:hypothetical protein ACSQ67_004087 [Phaseolus vulgaris]